MKKRFAIIVAVLTLAPSVRAQWEHISLPDVGEIASYCTMGDHVFAGTQYGGTWVSSDQGETWNKTSDFNLPGLGEDPESCLLAVGNKLYVAVGDDGSHTGNAVCVSLDGATSWQTLYSPNDRSQLVYSLGASGPWMVAGMIFGGLVESSDSGQHFSIRVDTGGNTNYYATHPYSIVIAEQPPDDGYIFVATENGIFSASIFPGQFDQTWITCNTGLADSSVSSLAVMGRWKSDSTQNVILFAGTASHGVFRSTDFGSSWQPANAGFEHEYIPKLLLDGTNLFATGSDQLGPGKADLMLSKDSGTTWQLVNPGDWGYATSAQLAVTGDHLLEGGTSSDMWRRQLSQILGSSDVASINGVDQSPSVFPIPFTQSTTITFTSREGAVADVSVVNILGAEVARIFSGELGAGAHSFMWSKPTGLSAGMYECIVRMNGNVQRVPIIYTR